MDRHGFPVALAVFGVGVFPGTVTPKARVVRDAHLLEWRQSWPSARHLGDGGIERWVVNPLVLWTLVFGG